MKLPVLCVVLFGLALFAGSPAQSATPADSTTTAKKETIDTRLCLDTLVTPLDALIDTRLFLLIYSPKPWAKIDTLTNPGTLLFVK